MMRRLVLVAVLLAACAGADDKPQRLAMKQVELGGQLLKVQVADEDAEHEKGLMFVKSMPQDEGMLFVWPQAKVRSFWMRNTFIPLDLIYLNGNRVVSVITWAKPFDETGLPSGYPADMVLEVNGGWTADHGIKIGDTLTVK